MRGPTTSNPGNRGGFGAPNSGSRPYQPPNSQPNMRGPTTSNPGNRGGFGAPNGGSGSISHPIPHRAEAIQEAVAGLRSI
jgi:hypothetical protein